MKKKILKSLKQIEKLADKNWMQGNLTIEFSGCPVDEWDQAIESINEFPRHRHIFEVAPGLNVSVLLN